MRVVAAPATCGGDADRVQPARRPRRGRRPGRAAPRAPAPDPGELATSLSGCTHAIRPSVLERAHDARHAEADLGAARQLRGERGAGPQPERVGEPEPDLHLARPAHPPALVERRRLELRVVAGVGDELQRLAEPERVGRVDRVALAGGVDAGDAADRREHVLRRRDGELVALADGPRVVAQALEQRGEREHQRHDAGAHRDRRHGGEPAPARGGAEARAEADQPAARCRSRARRAAMSPPRRISPAAGAPRATRATSRRPRRSPRSRRARRPAAAAAPSRAAAR